MFARIFALSMATSLLLPIADSVPNIDVAPSCRGAATANVFTNGGDRFKNCLDIEQKIHDELSREWSNYAPADRAKCVHSIMAFAPTYTELLTCLQILRDLRKSTDNNGSARPVAK